MSTESEFPEGKVVSFMKNIISGGEEDAFIVMDLEDVKSKLRAWKEHLPRVEPFYAVKCNNNIKILQLMVNLGLSFDCASKAEIENILSLGAGPERIIYANPCKQRSYLRYAAEKGVSLMTFDNADELHKIKKYHPTAKLLVRLLPDDSYSTCRLGQKFGADLKMIPSLLKLAKELELEVCGASYHVGSGCYNNSAFIDALRLAKKAFVLSEEEGFEWNILDIGGGFPGESVASWQNRTDPDAVCFPVIASRIREELDELFPEESRIRIIAEPGRYFVHSSATLAVNVIARRYVSKSKLFSSLDGLLTEASLTDGSSTECSSIDSNEDDRKAWNKVMYYVNEGVYGSFNNLIYDHAIADPKVLEFEDISHSSAHLNSSIWGHTCDGLDCIVRNVKLPVLEIGSWLYFENMGAYTISAASNFNGFAKAKLIYLD